MVGRVIPADGVILDVASGTAGVALQLAARSRARVVGVDLTEEMLRQGQRRVAAAGMSDRVVLVAGRAEQLPFPDAHFDALTFTYLLRYVRDPQATLAELARVLKPGGTMASLEFCVPTGALWGPAWWAYTRLALPAGGLLLGGPEVVRKLAFPLFLLLFMIIVGGAGSHAGAIIGAVFLYLAPFVLEPIVGHGFMVVFGVLVVLTILFQPSGLAGLLNRWPVRRAT